MPFYKWIIESKRHAELEETSFASKSDVNDNANKHMVGVIRHLSQLVSIASDIFGAIDIECKSIFQRTNDLRAKIQYCQDIVDNLDAKAVKVPVSSLSGNRPSCSVFKSSHVRKDAPIYSTFPRPPEVDRLRQLASGPSPPAFIPSHKIAPEADGDPRKAPSSSPTTTHIYCKPLPAHCKSPHNIEISTNTENDMTTVQIPSTVVPIDVSGQPFNRMASFRRSLIHVDFFIRRKKKKDKRRNTVAEGDTKALKDVLHNIINEECPSHKLETISSKCEKDNKVQNSKLKNGENRVNNIVIEEKNNNSSDGNISSIPNTKYCNNTDSNSEEKNKINATKNENVKLDLKKQISEQVKSSFTSKRKLKGHIPISTVSAAMNVAVEMRQLNGKTKTEDQSSSGNWSCSSDINSSDSENKTSENSRVTSTELSRADSPTSNEKTYQNRYRTMSANPEVFNSYVTKENKEIEISSCTSSDNNATHDDITSNDTSTESEVFFISSDESEDSSDVFGHNCGSSLSLSTLSDGSLNSLLSQTGTEMTSSSGTLTSLGFESLPPPPPPPPPAIVAAKINDGIKIAETANLNADCNLQKQMTKIQSPTMSNKKNKTVQKSSKPRKTEKDSRKYSTESPKNIFSTLINKKSKTREQYKTKNSRNSIDNLQNQPHINMYGSSSPKHTKPLPLFLKKNISPIKYNEFKTPLQSFSSNQANPKYEIRPENKPRSENPEPQTHSNCNSSQRKRHTNDIEIVNMHNKVEVPLKYVHKVTVTPIQRQTVREFKQSAAACRKTLFEHSTDQKQNTESNNDFKHKPNSAYSSNSNKEELLYSEKPKSQYSGTLQSGKPKSAARVLLDPEGRVIQCTNSLDRRLFPAVRTPNYVNNVQTSDLSKPHIQREIMKVDKTSSFYHDQIQYQDLTNINGFANINYNAGTNNRPNSICVKHKEKCKLDAQEIDGYYTGFPIFPTQNHTEVLNSLVSPETNIIKKSFYDDRNYSRTSNGITETNCFQNMSTVIPPNPNISGLPVNESLLTQHNINMHSKQMEKFSVFPLSEENSYKNAKQNISTVQSSPQSFLNAEAIKQQHSTMSTEDLFAVIHSCKKRMNIKTDSDISLASSSRSSSPSYFRSPSSRGALAETGFLSPRNLSSFDNSRDRRSWADFRPTNSLTPERKSLASDRLGPTKPTSMHDFKMLLLQTRSNRQVLGPRKSAVEMLKIPSSQNKDLTVTSIPLSPCNSTSYSVPNSPSSELYLYSGHSTVPFKRNNRARSSLQSRYTMYPPIFEDCSEDCENTRDIPQNCTETVSSDSEKINKNTQLQHDVNSNSCENTRESASLWL